MKNLLKIYKLLKDLDSLLCEVRFLKPFKSMKAFADIKESFCNLKDNIWKALLNTETILFLYNNEK